MLGTPAGRGVLRRARRIQQIGVLAAGNHYSLSFYQPPTSQCGCARTKATLAVVARPGSLGTESILPSHSLSHNGDLLGSSHQPLSLEDDIKVSLVVPPFEKIISPYPLPPLHPPDE